MPRKPSARGRVHIVLIPGFAGFDALGQLEYYAGVTPQFQLWKKSGASSRTGVALHYFDNFPHGCGPHPSGKAAKLSRHAFRARGIRARRPNRAGGSFDRRSRHSLPALGS